jgi:hypothetical protein
MLQRGGWAVVTTAFLFPIHDDGPGQSGDYFRFSPRALRYLFEQAGFVDVHVDGWGNREAVRKVAYWQMNNREVDLRELAERNEPDVPIMVWAWGRRP